MKEVNCDNIFYFTAVQYEIALWKTDNSSQVRNQQLAIYQATIFLEQCAEAKTFNKLTKKK